MEIKISDSYTLTDEEGSLYGLPVIFDHLLDHIIGPADIMEPYNDWGDKPAAQHIERLMGYGEWTEEEMALMERFRDSELQQHVANFLKSAAHLITKCIVFPSGDEYTIEDGNLVCSEKILH